MDANVQTKSRRICLLRNELILRHNFNLRLPAIKLNSSGDLELLPLQCRYRSVSSQRCASGNPAGKGLVRVGSSEVDKRVALPTC